MPETFDIRCMNITKRFKILSLFPLTSFKVFRYKKQKLFSLNQWSVETPSSAYVVFVGVEHGGYYLNSLQKLGFMVSSYSSFLVLTIFLVVFIDEIAS